MIDPFAPTYEAVPEAATQAQPAALSLFELNARVRAMLHHTLPDCYWVAAEISDLRVASNGHGIGAKGYVQRFVSSQSTCYDMATELCNGSFTF